MFCCCVCLFSVTVHSSLCDCAKLQSYLRTMVPYRSFSFIWLFIKAVDCRRIGREKSNWINRQRFTKKLHSHTHTSTLKHPPDMHYSLQHVTYIWHQELFNITFYVVLKKKEKKKIPPLHFISQCTERVTSFTITKWIPMTRRLT